MSGEFKGCPAGAPRSGAELHKPGFSPGAEASGLESDARAGIRPINSKPPVLASLSKDDREDERPTSARPSKGRTTIERLHAVLGSSIRKERMPT
jgi:hypothetical protein